MKFDHAETSNYSNLVKLLSRNILESSEFEKIKDSATDIQTRHYPNGNIESISFKNSNKQYIQLFNEDGTCNIYFSGNEEYLCDYCNNNYIKFTDCINKKYMLFKYEKGELIGTDIKDLNDSQINALKNIYLINLT